MSLKIKIRKTVLKRKVEGSTLTGYYGRVVSNGKTSFETVARESTRNTTLHPSEAELAAKMLLEGICEKLKQGYIVDLGPLGTLYPAVSGTWKTNADDLSLDEMVAKVNYRASDDIAAAVRAASLAWSTADDDDDNTTPAETGDNGDSGNGGPINLEG